MTWRARFPWTRARADLRVVTGADTTHAASLAQLLRSIAAHEPGVQVTAYDLGMTAQEAETVRRAHPRAKIKLFDYRKYPDYFDISRATGEYAWKPTIIWSELRRSDAPLLWLDAGMLVLQPMQNLRRHLTDTGTLFVMSSGSISDWTHPGTLEALGLPRDWGADLRNLAAGFVGFDPARPDARQLVKEWADGARSQDCIAPPGSSRANHRQDQALLSVLAHRAGMMDHLLPIRVLKGWAEVALRQEVDPKGLRPLEPDQRRVPKGWWFS